MAIDVERGAGFDMSHQVGNDARILTCLGIKRAAAAALGGNVVFCALFAFALAWSFLMMLIEMFLGWNIPV